MSKNTHLLSFFNYLIKDINMRTNIYTSHPYNYFIKSLSIPICN